MINFKRIMLAVLALCAIFCMAFAVSSCDGDDAGDDVTTTLADNGNTNHDNADVTTTQKAEDEVTTASGKITYKVKVVDANGNAVEGVFVQICEKKDGGRCFLPAKTDANGEISMELDEGDYKTRIDSANGYTYSSDYTEFGTETSVTITVTAN